MGNVSNQIDDIISKRKDLRENLAKIFDMHGYTIPEEEE